MKRLKALNVVSVLGWKYFPSAQRWKWLVRKCVNALSLSLSTSHWLSLSPRLSLYLSFSPSLSFSLSLARSHSLCLHQTFYKVPCSVPLHTRRCAMRIMSSASLFACVQIWLAQTFLWQHNLRFKCPEWMTCPEKSLWSQRGHLTDMSV